MGSAADFVQHPLELLVVVDVALHLATGHLVQGRHGRVYIALLNQRAHEAVEEGEQQDADVRAVHVRIRHADNAVVAQLAHVKVLAEAAAKGRNHGA